MSQQIYEGKTVRIVREDDGYVLKVSQRDFEAYLQNEWRALQELNRLNIRTGIFPIDASFVEKQQAIRMRNYSPATTLMDFLCSQEGISAQTTTTDQRAQLSQRLNIALQANMRSLDSQKLTSRLTVFLQVLGISDGYITHLSQNDLSPTNILVTQAQEVTTQIIDFNNAVHYTSSGPNPFEPLSKERPGYPLVSGIPIAQEWCHPDMTSRISTLHGSTGSMSATFSQNETYMAANVLYWSLTGKRLQKSSAPLVGQLPTKYDTLAEKVDKLIEEVRKPFDECGMTRIAQYRTEIAAELDAYKATIQTQAVPTVAARSFVLPTASQPPSQISRIAPYVPLASAGIGETVEAIKGVVDGYVKGKAELTTKIGELESQLAGLEKSKQGYVTALQTQRKRTNAWQIATVVAGGIALLGTAIGLSVGYVQGKNSAVCPPVEEVCATHIEQTAQFRELLDAYCSDCFSVSTYRDCLAGIFEEGYKKGEASVKCPVTGSGYASVVAERNTCNEELRDLQKKYKRLAAASSATDCSENLQQAYARQDSFERSAQRWEHNYNGCEAEKKTVEAERDHNFQLAHDAHAPEREVYGMAAAYAFMLPENIGKPFANPLSPYSFCGLMSHFVMPTAVSGESENVRTISGKRIDLVEMYLDGCSVVTPTTTP